MIVHGFRSARHIGADTVCGASGATSRAAAPVLSGRKSTCLQVCPPSAVLYTPRSRLGANGFPIAATSTTSGFFGWMITAPIWPALGRPRWDQVFPASLDLYTPLPTMTLLRMPLDPVPTYTMFGSDSATRMAPIDGVRKKPSETFCQLSPALVVFQTPPPPPPMS